MGEQSTVNGMDVDCDKSDSETKQREQETVLARESENINIFKNKSAILHNREGKVENKREESFQPKHKADSDHSHLRPTSSKTLQWNDLVQIADTINSNDFGNSSFPTKSTYSPALESQEQSENNRNNTTLDVLKDSLAHSRSPATSSQLGDDEYSPRCRRKKRITCDFIPERPSSRQGRYHNQCFPREDPSLIIGSLHRLESARLRREKSEKQRKRPKSVPNNSLLNRRETVVNLIYTGDPVRDDHSNFDFESEDHHETPRSRYLRERRASSVLSKMSMPIHPVDHNHDGYLSVEEEDFSRCSTSTSRYSCSPYSDRSQKQKGGFLYQQLNFDDLNEHVPSFVKQNVKKNGRLVTETFILRVNYLRRRRALGETSSTINNNAKQKAAIKSQQNTQSGMLGVSQ